MSEAMSQVETTETVVATESYVIECVRCHSPFDLQAAQWCSCLVNERTFVCTSCSRCFCTAPASYKAQVWRMAPRSLRDRKFEDHSAATASEPVAAPSSNEDRPLALVVEDDPVTRRVAAAVVERLGYRLIVAKDGAEGLEMTRTHRPSVVLTDALLPRLDGREMARQIKQDPQCEGIRVIVMTALYTGVKYQVEAKKSYNVDGYVAKPIAFEQLRAILGEPAVS
jgi:CheY-like chemotaxis protein